MGTAKMGVSGIRVVCNSRIRRQRALVRL